MPGVEKIMSSVGLVDLEIRLEEDDIIAIGRKGKKGGNI